MIARRIPGILPRMTPKEKMEVMKILSIAGLWDGEDEQNLRRPFRAPHHSLSLPALTGGGRIPRPGEVTLAHRGVLFLDELAEVSRNVLESLRQPLEEQKIVLSRLSGDYTFPADFSLRGGGKRLSLRRLSGYEPLRLYPGTDRPIPSQAQSAPFGENRSVCADRFGGLGQSAGNQVPQKRDGADERAGGAGPQDAEKNGMGIMVFCAIPGCQGRKPA